MKILSSLALFLVFLIVLNGCSENSSHKLAEQKNESEQHEISEPIEQTNIQVFDEIPEHIQEIENLTIFQGNSEPRYSIELIPVQNYGKSGEPFLTRVEACVVDDNGRVILTDLRINLESMPFVFNVHVYNADGTYRTLLGGPGRGPGEYGFAYWTQVNGGKVYLYDYTGKRLNVYNANYYSLIRTSLEESWDIRQEDDVRGLFLVGMKVRNDGNISVRFYEHIENTRMKNKYLLMDKYGKRLDYEPYVFLEKLQIATARNSQIQSIPRPFTVDYTLTTISDEGVLITADSQEFLIKKYNSEGIYQSSIYYPIAGPFFNLSKYIEDSNLSQVEVLNALDEVGKELPETSPIIDELIVDDENRIWVAVPTDLNSDTYEWWILDESGELLAKLQRQREKTIFDIKDGYLYAKEIDEETDAEYVVKYRIEWSE
ncbi:hypothetical protein IQ255_27145 [Pleurocapsales cyanobacterium LEGE 10410]|nr:hypothetical protein [Pleurocapsales cyanobacterium LEGE 10410]